MKHPTGQTDPEFPPIHVLICGGREFDDDYIITIFVVGFKFWHGLNVHIWHGDCPRGADLHAKLAANDIQGVSLHPYPADWHAEGRKAGPRRNTRMLKAMLSRAAENKNSVSFGIAFKDEIHSDSGTRDMVEKMLKADLPVYLLSRPTLAELRGK